MCLVEQSLSSRHLTSVGDDPVDLEALTPSISFPARTRESSNPYHEKTFFAIRGNMRLSHMTLSEM